MSPDEILSITMRENDANAGTVREYLKKLLATLWREQESFSGKRPFGNSDWPWDLYEALARAKAIPGEIDQYDELAQFDGEAAHAAILEAIESL